METGIESTERRRPMPRSSSSRESPATINREEQNFGPPMMIIVTFETLCTSDRFAISRIQRLQKNIPVTFSHIMATNTYLRGRQPAESAGSNCVCKQTEKKHANNNNPPPRHCKNTFPQVEFGSFSLVAPHTAMLW